jgi:hypothetical protein
MNLIDRIERLEEALGKGKPSLMWLDEGQSPPPDAPAGMVFVTWSDVAIEMTTEN